MARRSPNFRTTYFGLISLAMAMGIGRFAFTPLLPMMLQEGLVSIIDGGWLASAHFLGYWLGAVLVTRIPCPPKMMLRLSVLTIGVSTVAMGVTEEFAVWLFLRWLCGVASAWTLVLVSHYYVKHLADHGRTELQGWMFSGVGAGILVTGLGCLVFMIVEIGSSLSWQILGAASVLAAAVLSRSMGPEIPATRATVHRGEAQRSTLDWRAIIAYGATGFGYIVPATYLPVMARDMVPSPEMFGWIWPVFGAAAFASTLVAASLHKRYSNRQIWAASQAVMAAGLLLPVLYPHILTVIAAGIAVGGTFMIITMAGVKEANRLAPPEDVMRHIAVMTVSFASGQMIGPAFAGAVHDLTQSFAVALIVTSAALVITALILVDGPFNRKAVQR